MLSAMTLDLQNVKRSWTNISKVMSIMFKDQIIQRVKNSSLNINCYMGSFSMTAGTNGNMGYTNMT